MAAARASRSVPAASRAATAEATAGGRGEEEEKEGIFFLLEFFL